VSRWLLDTCVLCELVRGQPEPSVVNWLSKHANESSISVVSLGEIQYGIERLDIGRKRNRLQTWLDGVRTDYRARMLTTDDNVWLAWGRMKFESEHLGRPQEDLDLLIGATAKVHNLGLVTRNVRHFSDTGINVVNPWTV
jgi:toxin FitB